MVFIIGKLVGYGFSLPSKKFYILTIYAKILPIKNKATDMNENQKITQLRDWLLPMLMNGQVGVESK